MGMAVCGTRYGWTRVSLGRYLEGRRGSSTGQGPYHARTRCGRRAPAGASPFGVMDVVGKVWQWTEEFQDDHTRGGILRGGSYYQPQGSILYFPQAYKLS